MYDRVRLFARGFAVAAALVVGSAAGAATINVNFQDFGPSHVSDALAAADALRKPGEKAVSEDFESFAAWGNGTGTQNPATMVGTFTAIGGKGLGSSVIGDATKLQVRGDAPMAWNRINTSTGGNNWLDSNDTYGMKWDVGGLPLFDSLSFILTDVADQGGKFSIKIGDTVSEILGASGRLADGGIYVVSILLPEAVSSLSVLLHNDTLKDGFGIDNIRVALENPSPVPLPPAALLIIAGIGAIAVVRRRRSPDA